MQQRVCERVQKILSQAGVGSRRACEDLIRAGRVTVNGCPVTLGSKASPTDHIEVDGRPIGASEKLSYYMLNKPAGVLSSNRDDRDRPTVIDLVPAPQRVYPVGRLDLDSEGLVLLTNDGELAYRLTHPRFRVPKTYRVRVQGRIPPTHTRRLREGILLEDGLARAESATVLHQGQRASALEVVLIEGRKRQLRRMCAALGHKVLRLERVALASLELGTLKTGQWRRLTHREVIDLRTWVGLEGANHDDAENDSH